MFKKTTFAALAAAVVLTFSTATSFANPYYHGGHHRMNGDHGGYVAERMEQMTPDQKNIWKDWKQKNADLEKRIISKQVEWNWMTPEQGKARLERIDNWVKNDQPMTRKWDGDRRNDSDSRPYHKNNENYYGHGGRGYHHWNNDNDRPAKNFSEDRQKKFDYQASLTDEQKTQLQTWKTEKAELKKEWVNLQYNWGWITKEQAEYRIARLDDWAEKSFFHPYASGAPYHKK